MFFYIYIRAVVFRLFPKTIFGQKTVILPKLVGFRLTLYPIVRHIFHPICINLLELNTKVFILKFYKGSVVLISLLPLIFFENVTEQ